MLGYKEECSYHKKTDEHPVMHAHGFIGWRIVIVHNNIYWLLKVIPYAVKHLPDAPLGIHSTK